MKLIILFFFLLLNISHFVAADTSLDISARDPEANADVDTIKLGGPSPYQGQSCNCLRIRAEAAAARLEKRASYGLTFSNVSMAWTHRIARLPTELAAHLQDS
jgi:hypothetical protein